MFELVFDLLFFGIPFFIIAGILDNDKFIDWLVEKIDEWAEGGENNGTRKNI